jgi:hypothetical protein
MQLQPKSIDTSQNVVDIRKARNANELITVIGRINTALRAQQTLNSTERTKVKFGPLSKLYESLSWVLQTQAELQCAMSMVQHLNDAKRERCISAIRILNADLLDLKRTLISRVNSASRPLIGERMNDLANVIHDFLRPLCEKLYSIHMADQDATYVAFVARDVRANSGFVSPEVCIKLKEEDGQFYVSLPYSPFVETDNIPVSSTKDLNYFLKGTLNYQSAAAPKPKEEKLLRIEGVTKVDITDSLNLWLDSAVRPVDISNILRAVLPLIKVALAQKPMEILHRFNNEPGSKRLQFIIAKRKVIDQRALNRLTKMLALSRSQVTQMNSILEKP